MCRLLGLIANKPVDIIFYSRIFRRLAIENPDGWGIGYYEDGSPKIFKQGISALDPKSQFSEIIKSIRSGIIIVHLREETGTKPCCLNSHPFSYQKWLFAHNGSIDRNSLLALLKSKYKRELKGETDSEVYFYWILQNIEGSGDAVSGIKKSLKKLAEIKHEGLNFLLSDGETLYAFRYSKKDRKYYSLYKLEIKNSKTKEKVVIICSEKLTGENWKNISSGSLLKIDRNLQVEKLYSLLL